MRVFHRFKKKQQLRFILRCHIDSRADCVGISSLDMVHWAWEYDPDFFDGVRLADEPNEISLLLYTCCISFLKGNYSHQRSNFAELAHDCIPIIFGQFGSSLNSADRYVLDRYRKIVGLP